MPIIAGLPPIFTFADTLTPGIGNTVLVVHGFVAGVGGTGQVVGLALTSPLQSAGAPPIFTVVCFGMTVTGPWWQQPSRAWLLRMKGNEPSRVSRRSITRSPREDK